VAGSRGSGGGRKVRLPCILARHIAMGMLHLPAFSHLMPLWLQLTTAHQPTHPPTPQVRTMPLFSLKDHPNTLAPLGPDNLLVVLHNLGTVREAGRGEGGSRGGGGAAGQGDVGGRAVGSVWCWTGW
jgi:hypothetical protein